MKGDPSPRQFKATEQKDLDRAWHWHLQRMAERLFSKFRMFLVAGSALY
jgi:hypothetical protein